ncbi:Magnesium and cobalt efflux protein CorC [Salmonella enterica subsp. enterica]|nr:Magnesium and cobalt efflux protein CorC [Salmonella enterica subsp. enterica]
MLRLSPRLPPAIVVPETLDPINLLGVLRRARGSFVIVTNEFGVVQGLVTPLDVLEAIAGEFPDADETPEIVCRCRGLDSEGWHRSPCATAGAGS